MKLYSIIGIAFLGTITARLVLPGLPVVLTHSPSAPFGLYLKTHDPKDPYAIFCMNSEALAIAYAHRIIERGSCPDGTEPLMKPLLYATPRNPITFTHQGFSIHGHLLPNTAPKSTALDERPLKHYPFGIYREGIWAVSQYTPNSFDSRYFGPISKQSVIAYASPMLTVRRQ